MQNPLTLCEALLEALGDAVIALDAHGRIIAWNAAAEAIYGWPKEEVLGKNFTDYLSVIYDEPQETGERVIATLRANGAWSGVSWSRRKDGSEVAVRSILRTFASPDGQQHGVVAVSREFGEKEKPLYRDAQEQTRRLQALSHTLIQSQERERAKLAREFHDEIGQALTAIFLNLRTALGSCPESLAEAHFALADSLEIASRLMEQVRSISLDLHPKILDDLGFIPALRWLVNRTGKLARLEVRLGLPAIYHPLGKDIEFEIFRIVQETLTNVLRHAAAGSLDVRLEQHNGQTHLEIRDDGVGFEAEYRDAAQLPAQAFGLHSMFARADYIGAQLQISSHPGGGVNVSIRYGS